jgi:hypothetical protein
VGLTTSGATLVSSLIPIVVEKDKNFFEKIEKEQNIKDIIHSFYITKSA